MTLFANLLLILIFSVGSAAYSQTFKTRSDLVLVPAVVTDKSGTPILDLKKEEFEVQDQGTTQELTIFEDGNAPVDVALLLDNSVSMKNAMSIVRATAGLMFAKMRPATAERGADRAMLMFMGGSKLVMGLRDNKQELIEALSKPEAAAGGNTYLFSSIASGLRILNQEKDPNNENRKKIMIIVSDAEEFMTGYRDMAVSLSKSTSVTIYTLRVTSKAKLDEEKRLTDYEKIQDLQAWNQLANTTGGLSFIIPTENGNSAKHALERAFSDIGDEFGKQYFIGFQPSAIRIGLTNVITVLLKREGLTVRARKNYLIPDPRKL